jgi:hypothetical protein
MAADRPVIWISHRGGEACAGCAAQIEKGSFVRITQQTGIRCASCAGMADLVFLPSGDNALTRRALALSARTAVVVKFSRARGRNERQGALVEADALERAQRECEADAARREAARARRQPRLKRIDEEYRARFAERILELFPRCPAESARAIAERACERRSGRVGRSQAAKDLDAEAVTLALRAHVRHTHSRYDELLAGGLEPADARPMVAEEIRAKLDEWRGAAPRS